MSTRIAAIALAALVGVGVAACAQGQTDTWQVTLKLSGGFAGVDRELALSSSGAASATDNRTKRTAAATISGDNLAAISSLVAKARAGDPRPSGCADCFIYDVTVRVSERRVVIHEDDATLAASNAAALIAELKKLIDRLLSAP